MRRIPVAALMLLAAACGRDIPGEGQARAVRLLIVEPETVEAYVGLNVAFDVRIQREDGSIASVLNSPNLTLESSNKNIFTVDRSGAGRAVLVGEATIDARFEELAATVPVSVLDGTPQSLRIEPATAELAKGQLLQLRAVLTLTSGKTIDVTSSAFSTTYMSSDSSILTVDADGAVTGVGLGEAVVTAIHQTLRGTSRIKVNATANDFVAIELSPELMSIAIGQTSRFTLTGIRADMTREVIALPNPAVVFTIDNRAIATVNGDGNCTGVRRGAALVTVKLDALTDTARVDVRPDDDRVIRLEVRPDPIALDLGGTVQLTVTAFFASGATADVTRASSGTTYTPPRNRIIDVSPDGFVVGQAEGAGELTVSNGDIAVRVRVTVGGNLIGIRISPTIFTLAVNETGFFDVFAQFSDGSERVITFDNELSAFSLVPTVADIFTPGQVFALAPGFADLHVNYRGFFAFARVEVDGGRLISISISAGSPLTLGDTERYVVTGLFDDGSMADLTFDPNVIVFTDDPNILFVQLGFVTGQNAGTTNLNAQHNFGFFASTQIRVLDMGVTLSSIEIVAPNQVEVNGLEFFNVIAHWSDGSTSDITFDPGLSINSSEPMILDVNTGILFGISVGFSTLNASYLSESDSVRVEVVLTMETIIALVWSPLQLNVEIGVSSVAQLFAITVSGNQIDITHDPQVSYNWTGPFDVTVTAFGVEVEGNAVGNGEVVATYLALQATLPVNVGSAPEIIGIRVEPDTVLVLVGNTVTLTVFAQFSDGSEQQVTGALMFSLDPMIAGVTASGVVEGLSAGSTSIVVSYGFFTAFVSVQVVTQRPPQIATVTPDAIVVGSPDTTITLTGQRFNPGDTVLVGGIPVTTQVLSDSTITAVVPSFLLLFPGTLTVEVTGINGTSNTVTIAVGEPPTIASWSPNGLLAGTSVVATVVGTGLSGLSASSTDLSTTVLESAADGTWVRIRVTASANLSAGSRTVTVTNDFGAASFTMDVIATTGLMDLVVAANQTITLSGTHAYNNVTVQTGGRIVGSGTSPLAILAAGDIIIRGSIDINGANGALGFTNPANGGAGGPGGGGGGGGGDGDAMVAATGGVGAPNGGDAFPGFGSGTPAGNGGGDGSGGGAAFQCGAGGGGGALGGDGGGGGGDFGPESGGFGGIAGGNGSDFGAGTGGGGGTTCGNNSGGGGGGGGGGLVLQTAPGHSITIDGMIRANGGNGGDGFNGTGGGGAGSGGRVEIHAEAGTILVNDTISVRGGNGGHSDFGDTGGGGGGGTIILDATPGGSVTAALGFLDVTAGVGGVSLGGGNPGVEGGDGTFSITP